MQVSTGKTEGANPHPADWFANIAAQQIADLIEIVPNSNSDVAKEARKAKPRFQLAVAEALEEYFDGVQVAEREHLDEHGNLMEGEHLEKAARFDPTRHHNEAFSQAVDKVTELARGTPFEAGFASDSDRAVVCSIIATHMATAQYIEHSLHKDLGKTWRKPSAEIVPFPGSEQAPEG